MQSTEKSLFIDMYKCRAVWKVSHAEAKATPIGFLIFLMGLLVCDGAR